RRCDARGGGDGGIYGGGVCRAAGDAGADGCGRPGGATDGQPGRGCGDFWRGDGGGWPADRRCVSGAGAAGGAGVVAAVERFYTEAGERGRGGGGRGEWGDGDVVDAGGTVGGAVGVDSDRVDFYGAGGDGDGRL